MTPDWQERTEMLFGGDAIDRLSAASVTIVGVGGVGAAAAEMLVRAGIGHLTIIDSDEVSLTNVNRQLIALHSTVGKSKVKVLSERLMDINPELDLYSAEEYLHEDNVAALISGRVSPDYVVDAIDTLSPKVALIQYCLASSLPLVSSMGSGAKIDATKIRVADIDKTSECPLAHMLRKRLHKLGIRGGFQAVYSTERPMESAVVLEESRNKKSQVGTVSYLPTVFGCVCAQTVIKGILQL